MAPERVAVLVYRVADRLAVGVVAFEDPAFDDPFHVVARVERLEGHPGLLGEGGATVRPVRVEFEEPADERQDRVPLGDHRPAGFGCALSVYRTCVGRDVSRFFEPSAGAGPMTSL